MILTYYSNHLMAPSIVVLNMQVNIFFTLLSEQRPYEKLSE